MKKYEFAKWRLPTERAIRENTKAWRGLASLDFGRRHWVKEVIRRYGVWRWPAMMLHRKLLLKLIDQSEVVIDLGGNDAKLGFGSYVVDISWGVKPEEFYEKFRNVDLLFSSGTLEHIEEDTGSILKKCKKTMKRGGVLFLQVDSYRNRRWQHTVKRPAHHHTFYINADIGQKKPVPVVRLGPYRNGGGMLTRENMKVFTNIEKLTGRYFDIKFCKNVPDYAILIVAKKK